MKMFLPMLLLPLIYIGNIDCLNLTKRYFLTINISGSSKHDGTKRCLTHIDKKLCSSRVPLSPVTCFLKFKVVGEPRVIVVVDVQDSEELERRLLLLSSACAFQYESEPIVGYDQFARFLGVEESLIQLDTNTLENVPEALWCEFNINFGDKNTTEILAIWKQEAEVVLTTRNSGVPLEIFKTLGERTVHLLVEIEATAFDLLLFGTPFNQQIPNTLTTMCKTVVNFQSILYRHTSSSVSIG